MRTLIRKHERKRIPILGRFFKPLLAGTCAIALCAMPAIAQDGVEYEPDEGFHEEEWYDPSDWFDDDETIDYEADWWDTTYNDDYTSNIWGERDYWYDDADLVVDYDWYDRLDYGWHYKWNSDANEWQRDYGWHNQQFEYYTEPYYNSVDYRTAREEDRMKGKSAADKQTTDRGEYTLRGTLKDFKKVELRDEKSPHTVVRMRTEDDRSAVIDLGPDVNLKDLNLEKDATFVVRGKKGTINDQTAIFAHRITVEDNTTRISHNRGESTDRRLTAFNGLIEDHKKVTMKGQREGHTLLRVKLEDGSKRIVNIGPKLTLKDLNLEEDDYISVTGRKARVNDKDVLIAHRITADGQVMHIAGRTTDQTADRMNQNRDRNQKSNQQAQSR